MSPEGGRAELSPRERGLESENDEDDANYKLKTWQNARQIGASTSLVREGNLVDQSILTQVPSLVRQSISAQVGGMDAAATCPAGMETVVTCPAGSTNYLGSATYL